MYLPCRTSRPVSREGYHFVFFIVDHATKMCLVIPLKTRKFKHILAHLTTFVNEVLQSNISYGDAELVAAEVLGFLHKSGVTTSHSPRDTPRMNSVTERGSDPSLDKIKGTRGVE